MLNAFVDFTLQELSRTEAGLARALFRDTKPDGTARTSQADLARRAGVNVRTVKRAVAGLERRGLLARGVPGQSRAGGRRPIGFDPLPPDRKGGMGAALYGDISRRELGAWVSPIP